MRRLGRAISVLIAAILLAALAIPSHAQAFLYAGKRKKINCGIVVVNSGQQPLTAGMDASGYTAPSGGVGDLFFLLEMRTDMKPAGWSFDNPLAPGGPATGLSKADPRYWLVDLAAAPDLSMMNVLYLPAYGTLNLAAQDREKLRQFVDGGGVLWIDNAEAGGLDFANTFFILNFRFVPASGGSDFPLSRHHPVLSLPFWLTDWDIANLGAKPGQAVCIPGYDPGPGNWEGKAQPVSFDVLYPVVGNTSGADRPSVAANAYGSGRIVATSTYVGRGCYFNPASLKFAYNVIAWASSWTHLRKDPRHSGASIDTVGGTKLLEIWSLPVPASGGGSSGPAVDSAPVIYKNVVFYTSGNTLFALDMVPQEDLDHDGAPDDGFPDLPSGMTNKGQDLIWFFESPTGNLSTPSVVTAQDPKLPGQSMEVVLVASAGGMVYMLPAFPLQADGRMQQNYPYPPMLVWNYTQQPNGTVQPNANPGPPLYANGWIYATSGDGRICAYNPSLEAWGIDNTTSVDSKWTVPTCALNVGLQGQAEPRTGPCFGYAKSDTSGATVGMVYWFAGPWNISPAPAGAEQNDHVYAVPVHVANDRVRIEKISPNGLLAQCRISYGQAFVSSVPEPIAYIRSGGGTEVKATVYPNCVLSGNTPVTGTVSVGFIVVEGTTTIFPDSLIHATYALDYASSTGIQYTFAPRVRQPLEPRSNSQNSVPKTTIASMPALGPDNMIFLAGQRDSGPPAIYGLSNDGSTQYSRWIYLLHGEVKPDLLAGHTGADMPIPGVVYDTKTGFSIDSPQVFSSPAVWGDKVFVTVSGLSTTRPPGTPPPTAALLCFKANSNFVIRITENAGYDATGGMLKKPKRLRDPVTGAEKHVMLWQPNFMGSTTPAMPLQVARAVRRDMVDYEKGTITFTNFDTMKLLGGALNVQATNCFSPSLPVYVFLDNVEVPIDWSTWGPSMALWQQSHPGQKVPPAGDSVDLSGWNNLLWFFTVPVHKETQPGGGVLDKPCKGIKSSPVVIGNNVYFVCDDGYLYCYPTEPGENSGGPADPKLLVWEGKVSEETSVTASSGSNLSMAGSNGVLLVPTPQGLHAYTNATTLIADSNRLVETDGAGEIKWSLSSISWPVSAPTGNPPPPPSMTSGPINKPSRARYLPSGEILMVNSAANQVCRVDKSGTAGLGGLAGKSIRGLYDRFIDPKNLLRPGQPTSLSSPTDALFWQEYETQADGTRLRVDHCVIADSGNHRVLDLVYRFNVDKNGAPVTLAVTEKPGEQPDPSTGFYLPELNWTSATDSTNERYVYDCIQLVTTPIGGVDIWAAVSNYRGSIVPVNKVQTEGLGGAIFALGYRVPGGPGGASWNYSHADAGRIVAACDRIAPAPGGDPVPLACPRFFQVIDRPPTPPSSPGGPAFPGGRFMLICDNYGVYEVALDAPGVPLVRRALRDKDPLGGPDYRNASREMRDFMNGGIAGDHPLYVPLVATSVQELMNGNWLIVNSYSGPSSPTPPEAARPFSGEVFELSWQDDLVTPKRIEWSSPSIYVLTEPKPNPPGGTTILWDTWKQRLENGYVFQQPRSAVRQM